jgi:hypothetical protein
MLFINLAGIIFRSIASSHGFQILKGVLSSAARFDAGDKGCHHRVLFTSDDTGIVDETFDGADEGSFANIVTGREGQVLGDVFAQDVVESDIGEHD